MAGRILIVDDDRGFAQVLARGLRRAGHDVTISGSAAETRSLFGEVASDVVVLDYQLPDADGLGLLDELRPYAGGTVFVIATAYPDLDVAVEAMRRGAFDYFAKGSELKESLIRIERAAEVAQLRRRMAEASQEGATHDAKHGLLGESGAMAALRKHLDALTGSDDTTVLILGETGTGKGVVARAIHALSGRAFEPFVAVDCTTIPATLIESELFGHEKGAFSGATSSKMGRVEAAGAGTLFLDEIGELDLAMQTKLLRLLEEREYTRVGGTRPRRLEARIIAATNRDLERAVEEGRFRADLRYRLEVFVARTPPLRERGDDIFLLTAHFAAERARALGRPEPRLSAKVIEWLPRYPFPGNVRELRNMVEQAVLLAKGEELTLDEFPVLGRMVARSEPAAAGAVPPERLEDRPAPAAARAQHVVAAASDLRAAHSPRPSTPRERTAPPETFRREARGPEAVAAPSGAPSSPEPSLEAIRLQAERSEREAIIDALERSGGNVAAAARSLDLSRYQLLRRLKKHGLR